MLNLQQHFLKRIGHLAQKTRKTNTKQTQNKHKTKPPLPATAVTTTITTANTNKIQNKRDYNTMGSVLSYNVYEDPPMRLASREECDDETWANTVRNRSPVSVQQLLNRLHNESDPPEAVTKPRKSRLCFGDSEVLCYYPVENEVVEKETLSQKRQRLLFPNINAAQYVNSYLMLHS